MLGCEDGLNLLSFATAYPSAQIVGVELASESLPEKQKNADILLPTNLHLYSLYLEALLGNAWENFDYIIVQGSFSMLANEVTDLLLAFFQQKLSVKGIIALDWFCQPRAKSMEALRDAIQLHSCRGEILPSKSSREKRCCLGLTRYPRCQLLPKAVFTYL